jgi:hypothetical protein
MTVRIELGGTFLDCPLAWRSFIIHTHKSLGYGSRTIRRLSDKQIQKGLEQFKAEFIDCGCTPAQWAVDFPSEAHYNLFVLKYGEEHVKR